MLNKIAWDDFFLIGVEEIDVQHKHLTEMVNRCVNKANGFKIEEDMTVLLEDLWFYTKWHFSCEESLMKILNYPKFTEHEKEHNLLLEELDEKIEQIIKNNYFISDLRDFLYHWFGEHSHGHDKDLGAFVVTKWN